MSCVVAATALGQGCRITTVIRVLNGHGQFPADLSPEQLRVRIGSEPAKVTSVSRLPRPAIILLIDISSSMKEALKPIVETAKHLLAGAGDNVAVAVFRERILAYEEGRKPTEELLDQLTSLMPSGAGTALWDTLVEVAGKVKKPNTVLVVISDGKDNVSHHSPRYAVDGFLKNRWPPVFGLVLDYDHHEEFPEIAKHEDFDMIVTESGGGAEYPLSAADIKTSLGQLSSEINAPFKLVVEATQPILKPQKLTIESIGVDGKPSHVSKILHVSKIAACDEP